MSVRTTDPRAVRPSVIAGTWYPDSPSELAETIDHFLAQAPFSPTTDDLLALIAPHAGYAYSGPTAAAAYRQVTGRTYDTVILLGPSHSDNFGPYAVTSKHAYATPLGQVELDLDFIDELDKRIPITRTERDHEHSLEIQLPFLQRVLGEFKLVPIMMLLPLYMLGRRAVEPCAHLAAALADLARDRRALFVASSDLSHLSDYRLVDRFDAVTAQLVEALDLPGLTRYMSEEGECRACGDGPVITSLDAAARLGANRVQVVTRTHSSDVTGNYAPGQYTVGYLAAAVYRHAGRES